MCPFSYKALLALSLLTTFAVAQTPTTPFTLRHVARGAGYIFSGTVTAVEFVHPTKPDEFASVRITFRVDEGVRGVRSRQFLTIREWAGLWNASERYHLGERVVLALYPPSKLGLTSPVGGPMGRFPLDSDGFLALPPGQNYIVASDPRFGSWLRGKERISGRNFARMLERAAKE